VYGAHSGRGSKPTGSKLWVESGLRFSFRTSLLPYVRVERTIVTVGTLPKMEPAMTTPQGDSARATAAVASVQVLEDQVAAIKAHDVARFADFYSEDTVVRDPQYTESLHGRTAVANYFSAFLPLKCWRLKRSDK
jgi:hypothetical protein